MVYLFAIEFKWSRNFLKVLEESPIKISMIKKLLIPLIPLGYGILSIASTFALSNSIPRINFCVLEQYLRLP
jgi:hypothetical protein